MSNLTSTLTLQLVDDGLAKKAAADAEALRKLGLSGADLKKLAASNPAVAKTVQNLDALAARGSKLDAFRAGARNLKDLGQQMRLARAEVGATAAALAKADGKGSKAADKAHKAALRRSETVTEAWREQARAHRDLRKSLLADGVGYGGRGDNGGRGLAIGAAMRSVAAETEHANHALREQVRLVTQTAEQARAAAASAPQRAVAARDALRSAIQAGHAARAERIERERAAASGVEAARADRGRRRAAASRDMLEGMGGAGRAQLGEVAARRRISEGMGAAARAKAKAASEAEEARAASVQDARERGKQVVGAGLLVAGHKAAEKKDEVLHTYNEFDDLIRYQGAVADLTPDERRSRVHQAVHLGGTTRFNDIQVLHAQLDLAQRGVKKEFIEPFIGEVVNYAQAMNTDLGSAAKTLEGIVFGTNQDVENPASALQVMRKNVDQAVKMAKIGGLDNEDVAQAFKFGGPSGSGAGLGNPTMMAIFSLLRRTGFAGAEAGVATRAVASKLVSPTNKGLDALTAMGLNYNDYTTMPPDARPEIATGAFKRQFGKELTKDQKAKIAALMDDPDRFGDQGTFITEATGIVSSSFEKTKKGKMKAADQKAIAKVFGNLWKNMVANVDSERLFSDILNADPTLAQANAFFTDKHGGKIQALARKKELFAEYREKLSHTPENFAKGVGDQRNAGYAGASARLAGSNLNLDTAVARSLDNEGEGNGGFLTALTSAAASATQALAELPASVLAVGASIGYLGGKLSSLVGGALLTGTSAGVATAIATGNGAAVVAGATAAAAVAAPVVATAVVGAALVAADKDKAIVHGGKNVDGRQDFGDELPGLAAMAEAYTKPKRTPSLPPGWGPKDQPSIAPGNIGPNGAAASQTAGVKSLIDQRAPKPAGRKVDTRLDFGDELPGLSGVAEAYTRPKRTPSLPPGWGPRDQPSVAPGNVAPNGGAAAQTAGVKSLIDQPATPKVETGKVDELSTKLADAAQKAAQLSSTSATPQVGTGPIDSLIAKIGQAISMLGQLEGGVASANAGIARVNSGALRGRSGASFSDGVTPGAGAQ